LAADQIESMYQLFENYYNHANRIIFLEDLMKKDFVFLMEDQHGKIQGFSTIVSRLVEIPGLRKKIYSHFSGDTVIAKEFWGQRVLGIMFLKHLFWEKLKKWPYGHYWLLITKGYKTYLLMANNCPDHYPRFEKKTPSKEQNILHGLARIFFQETYDEQSGLLLYSQKPHVLKDSVKEGIAEIDPKIIVENKRINFFVKKNPTWKQGDELVCIAEMNLLMPFQYQLKSFFKLSFNKIEKIKKRFLRTKIRYQGI
jgi:hypothetical protein